MLASISCINPSTYRRNSRTSCQIAGQNQVPIQHHTSFDPYPLTFDPEKIINWSEPRKMKNDRLRLLNQTSYKLSQTNEILSIDSSKLGIKSPSTGTAVARIFNRGRRWYHCWNHSRETNKIICHSNQQPTKQKSNVELHRTQITVKDDAIITMLPLLESQSRDE